MSWNQRGRRGALGTAFVLFVLAASPASGVAAREGEESGGAAPLPVERSPAQMISYYEARLREAPDDFEGHWRLAGAYLASGFGRLAAEHFEKTLALDASKAEAGQVYSRLAMAYYFAGDLQAARKAVDEALARSADDGFALSLKTTLEAVAARRAGTMSPNAEAALADGVAELGETEDAVVFDFGELVLRPPAGWAKRANLGMVSGRILLFYTPDVAKRLPAIGVTRDAVGPEIETAMDYARSLRKDMTAALPKARIPEPRAVTAAGLPAAVIEVEYPGGTAKGITYQFLFGRSVVSLQLISPLEGFDRQAALFHDFVEGMRLRDAVASVGRPAGGASSAESGGEGG